MWQRLEPARRHYLTNKRLFIMPSRAGAGFMVVALLLWLTGTNYENNIVLGLAFFLTALFVVTIFHTFFNMARLGLDVVRTGPCFAGDEAEVELRVFAPAGTAKENLQLSFDGGRPLVVDLIQEQSAVVKLFTSGPRRGWCQLPRLTVASQFPLGIIRCWSWLRLDAAVLVYPRPVAGSAMPVSAATDREGDRLEEAGAEDFHGFKPYQVGISPRHIAWKHYARGQGLYSKEYASYREQQVWLDWDALDGLGTEARLSRLCYWVIRLSATRQPYGLRLPGVSVPPSSGVDHKHRLLKTLALYRPDSAGTQS